MNSKITITLLISLLTGHLPAQSAERHPEKTVTFLCPPCGLYCDTLHFDQPGTCPVCLMKLFASYPEYENRQGNHGDQCAKTVAVVLFPGVEIIDFSGPWEVFGAAGMEIFSVAADDSILYAGMGLKIKPDYTFFNAPTPDIILVPGGNVDASDTAIVNWIKKTSPLSSHTMSVCTGAFYLAAAGLLDSLDATTNFPAVSVLKSVSPGTSVSDTVRFVDNGRIITSAGLSSGIDAAFHLVSLYIGKSQAQKLANELEYGWDDGDPFIRGKLADKHVQDFLYVLTPFDYTMTTYSGDRGQWTVSVNLKTELSEEEIARLMNTQFEQVSGWHALKQKNRWAFEDYGKKWRAALRVVRHGERAYHITLKCTQIK